MNGVDSSPLSLRDFTEYVKLGQRFIIPKVHAFPDVQSSTSMFDLSFRSASLEALDNDTLPIEIPTFVPMVNSMGHVYVARLHPVNTSVPTSALSTNSKLDPNQVGSKHEQIFFIVCNFVWKF